MPILDPKVVQAEIDARIAKKRKDEQDGRDFNSPSSRKKRAEGIEKLLTENITPGVLQLLGTKTLSYRYSCGDTSDADLTVWSDGLRHSHVTGSWWNHLASPRQIASKMAEHGVGPASVEEWLKKELALVRLIGR